MKETSELPQVRERFYRRERQSVPAAREFARAALTDWAVGGERAQDILLCVSELTTNALVHGVPPGRGFLLRVLPYEDGVRVEVHDSGDGVPAVPRPDDETTGDADAEGGRGLLLVETLAVKWGVGERDPGKVVWCELATARRAPAAMSSGGSESRTDVTQPQEERVTQLLKVQNFNVSSDGFGAGEGQSLERPFGHAEPGEMFSWCGATASWPNRTDPGGSRGLDDYLVRDFHHNIGAEIMGRNKFGPQRGPWQDLEWQGWWGDEPPFHTPVFVMTHHPRPSITLSDTTFHFVDADPATVLEQARAAAGGKDVRLGGGASVIREFLDADLVDTLHVAVSPVKLGSGTRLWESPDELRDRFHVDVVPSPGGTVTHHLFWRK